MSIIKIAYLSSNDPTDKKVWSGTHYSIYSALKKHVGEVIPLGPYEPKLPIFLGKILTGLSQKILNKRYNYRHSKLVSKAYGIYFTKKLKKQHFDLIVAPAALSELAYIETNVPIIYISDSTIQLSLNYHNALTGLLPLSEQETKQIEQLTYKKCSKIIVSSVWALNSLRNNYQLPESKIASIPFGANMEKLPSKMEVKVNQEDGVCNLLFIGVYWKSKGGEIAYNCLLELLKLGVNAHLTICGCIAPEQFKHEKMSCIPFINKNTTKGQQKLFDIFSCHDFLILPTRFDCTPIVICEASAFSLPAIVANTGGVAGHLTEGKNGFLIDYTDKGKGYAKKIAEIYQNKDLFTALKISTRLEYENRLNWENYGVELKKIADSILSI